jgi:hypothetical protein
MAQTGYTPISIYYSATTTNVPTAGNLVAGELAINTADGKLFYKDSSGVVQVIASKAGVAAGSNTQVQYNSSGSFAGSANFVFDGTNVGIGTSSPAQKLDIGSAGKIYLRRTDNATGTTINNGGAGVGLLLNDLNAEGYTFQNNGTGVMRIDASGNVGIGTTSPSVKLDVRQSIAADLQLQIYNNNAGVYATSIKLNADNATGSNYNSIQSFNAGTALWSISGGGSASTIAFNTGSSLTERMRIDNNGTLCVGTSSAIVSNVGGISVKNTVGNGYPCLNAWNAVVGTSGNPAFLCYFGTGTSTFNAVGSITNNGTTTLYNATSDQRLKENIVDAGSGIEKLSNIKIRSFNWIENKQFVDFGVIAQEINTIAPEAVSQGEDNEDGTIKMPWQVDTSALVPAMIKAIQELNAKVTALEAQLGVK